MEKLFEDHVLGKSYFRLNVAIISEWGVSVPRPSRVKFTGNSPFFTPFLA